MMQADARPTTVQLNVFEHEVIRSCFEWNWQARSKHVSTSRDRIEEAT